MLPKHQRLSKDKDFKKVYKFGSGAKSRFFTLRALKNKLNVSRFGFVVDLQVSKKATVRNLLKRRMRAIVRENLSGLRQGYDVVIRVKKEAVDKEFTELKNDLEFLFKKVNLFR
jgi:ribonuclease P protein component